MTPAPGRALLDFAAGVRLSELPKPAVDLGRLAVLDWWGVTVAGAGEPVAGLLRAAVLDGAPGGPASVLGTARRAAPVDAALLNGTAAHALDYDDVHLSLPGHVTAPILPGLLAAAEARRLGGWALLTAFLVGVEVTCRIARALAPGHYRAGWHATATLGRLGGAVAATRLLGLDASRLDQALGLAAAQVGGIQESFGTMAKPVQVGRAAADALLSALAVERGVTARAGLLEEPGWARRLSPDWHPDRLAEGLGRDLAVGALVFKRYPCCFAAHASVRGVLRLRPGLDPAAIERVDLDVCPTALQVADQREPKTGLAGKFSTAYCAAAALLRGHVREDDFTDAAVAEPAVRALAARVRLHAAPAFDETRARVTVGLAGGAVRAADIDLRAGEDVETTARELRDKFRGLVAPRLGAAEAERLLAAIGRLEDVEDVRHLAGP